MLIHSTPFKSIIQSCKVEEVGIILSVILKLRKVCDFKLTMLPSLEVLPQCTLPLNSDNTGKKRNIQKLYNQLQLPTWSFREVQINSK